MEILNEISQLIQKGNAKLVPEKVKEALSSGISAETILNDALIQAMSVVGEKFKNNEIYVPEVLIAARAMKAALEVLKPILTETGVKPIGKVVIGTVKGDLHDIGKNLVAMMMTGAGLEVIDLGVDVAPEKFCEAVKNHNPQIVAMSALLTTTMPNMKTTIEKLQEQGLRDKVKVIVGGAPVTESFAKSIGADGYAPDAASAAELAKKFVKGAA
ncbi:5-methyltetrahydrofolate--homocysteine methyltransferase [Caldicellulosiruptor bescii]|uniref:Methionine synthase n=2 Tax=Caldicellulosiruptor bescii TaxID=31899 RepID=B9MP88_CALBD|nr:corrinoid protein [Caldicellulosiruptor bescii]ACM61647.1 Methionine synthase [Caldicellulosiruptor bescii DSM 6725]PBC88544.1 5-methyltetrahydrofolate--homocysteine methyltransferase [Caldicellulosiruptor bescii]PBC91974.1 5-methyltetrahydrofolate--homocysteine methyltransferase [Caldicellulosiruptor bescii]PBD02614.1 5-methyltetrahydrofolate--homocysteine methyltransferase [Caldicellulosiruptor bescii]PBD05153.1 5-methyltetrahydrofolate--homocysteine methyltransferase [Caldicellulosirupto